ncbi:MAG: ComEC/Rec2 family competence protein [candidate division WOR-3 bacterium]|nr:ComEC/Rec2 family competence protein [candidate division WOR-3 bacterium]
MINPFTYFFLSFVSGILCSNFNNAPIILVILLFACFFTRRRVFSASLVIIFSAGIILGSIPHGPQMNEGYYSMNPVVRKSFSYGYIIRYNSMDFYLNSDKTFFEGDRIDGVFSVNPIVSSDGFNEYLISHNVLHKARIVKLKCVSPGSGIERIRMNLVNRNRSLYRAETAGFVNSILLGYKRDLDRMLKESFRHSGILHFLAISGLHTGIIYSIVLLFLFPIPVSRYIKIIAGCLIMIFYAFLTYGNPPVIRAVMFIVFANTGFMIKRRFDKYSVFFIAAMILLFINPDYIGDAGFQLSFIAVYAILKYIDAGWIQRGPAGMFLLSAVILIFTFPVVSHHFGYFSLLSPLVTLILIIPFTLTIVLGVVSMIPIFSLLHYAVEGLYSIMANIVNLSSNIPLFFRIETNAVFALLTVLYLGIIFERQYRIGLFAAVLIMLYTVMITF